MNDFDSSDEKRAFIYDSLGLLVGPDLSRVPSYRRGLSLFFLFPPFPVIVGSIVVLLSFYCCSIVFLLSFYCPLIVVLLSFHGRSIVNLLMVLCFFCFSLSFEGLHFLSFFYLCYFFSLFELCEIPLSSFRHNRSLSVGRYHIVVSLSCFFIAFSFVIFLCLFFPRIPGSFPRLWLICC